MKQANQLANQNNHFQVKQWYVNESLISMNGGNEQQIEYTGNSLIIIYNDENDDLHCDIDLDCYRRLMGYNVTIIK